MQRLVVPLDLSSRMKMLMVHLVELNEGKCSVDKLVHSKGCTCSVALERLSAAPVARNLGTSLSGGIEQVTVTTS